MVTVQQPAVSTKDGGVKRSGAVMTLVGEKLIELYHSIEGMTSASAHQEFQSIAAPVRHQGAGTHSVATQQRTSARHCKRFEIAGPLNSRFKRKSACTLKVAKGPTLP